ncbi:MAG: ATP-binding cassette domain-containing protein [Rikenellaceae bacterium]
MSVKPIIEIRSTATRQPQYQLNGVESLTINRGEQIAIVGGNGSGKSILVGILTGAHPLRDGDGVLYDFGVDAISNKIYDNIKYIAFRDSTAASGGADSGYFYQQRWNSTALEDSPRVCDELPSVDGCDNRIVELREKLFELFKIDKIYDKRLVLLSSGEMRKFQITKALLNAPQMLIMDNPFIGLDAATRDTLHILMGDLAKMGSVQIVVVLSKTDDIPKFITHIIELKSRTVTPKCTLEEYYASAKPVPESVLPNDLRLRIEELPVAQINNSKSDMVAQLRNVSIKYGDRTILKSLDWSVRQGERWALSGENGSGKSTLLSLVCADNPQAYACDIALFGRDRGTGESIWDIKRHIGYVSPEMHRAYLLPNRAIEIVASGLHDTIGLNRKMQPEQIDICRFWMEVFGVEALEERIFTQLSSGEQRLILLARAFVKDPALLILDEPLHGLDMTNRRRVTEIIECFSLRPNKSLIMVTHYPAELPSTITNSIHLKRN